MPGTTTSLSGSLALTEDQAAILSALPNAQSVVIIHSHNDNTNTAAIIYGPNDIRQTIHDSVGYAHTKEVPLEAVAALIAYGMLTPMQDNDGVPFTHTYRDEDKGMLTVHSFVPSAISHEVSKAILMQEDSDGREIFARHAAKA